eukprot:3852712-Rhodomonas_salina.2
MDSLSQYRTSHGRHAMHTLYHSIRYVSTGHRTAYAMPVLATCSIFSRSSLSFSSRVCTCSPGTLSGTLSQNRAPQTAIRYPSTAQDPHTRPQSRSSHRTRTGHCTPYTSVPDTAYQSRREMWLEVTCHTQYAIADPDTAYGARREIGHVTSSLASCTVPRSCRSCPSIRYLSTALRVPDAISVPHFTDHTPSQYRTSRTIQ